jgi:hypothetical protein
VLLVIFGAGASYDSRWDLYPGMSQTTPSAIRPPLTADLFSNDIPAMRDAFQQQTVIPAMPPPQLTARH